MENIDMKTAPAAVVEQMLRLAEQGQNPSIQPSILLTINLDPTKIAELKTCYVNDSWTENLRKMLDNDFIIFRVQTEFGINGHVTIAYLAKMKP